jgi:hypothetical protein
MKNAAILTSKPDSKGELKIIQFNKKARQMYELSVYEEINPN